MVKIINAEGIALGRVGSIVAKELLKGEKVVVINSEKAIISGNKKRILDDLIRMRKMGGNSLKGPKFSRVPEKLLKRKIRGMLPWNKPRGRELYKNLKCYSEIPKEFKGKEKDAIKLEKKSYLKSNTLGEICKLLG